MTFVRAKSVCYRFIRGVSLFLFISGCGEHIKKESVHSTPNDTDDALIFPAERISSQQLDFGYTCAIHDALLIGDYLYLSTHGSGLKTIDVSNKKSPVLTHQAMPQVSDERSTYYSTSLGSLHGNSKYIYTIDWFDNLLVFDIETPDTPRHVGTFAFDEIGARPSKIWVMENYIYVLDDSASRALHVINCDVPSAPEHAKTLELSSGTTHIHGEGDYLYLSSYSGSNLTIVDVSNRANPTEVSSTELMTTSGDSEKSLAIWAKGHYAYVALDSAVHVVDVSMPETPVQKIAIPGLAPTLSGYNTHLYVGTADGFSTVDISNPEDPQLVSSKKIEIPKVQMTLVNPNIIPTREIVAGPDFVIPVFGYTGGIIYDTSAPAQLELSRIPIEESPSHLYIKDDLLLVSHSLSGFSIYDVADRSRPQKMSQLNDGIIKSVARGNYAYVALHQGGLKVVDISDPANPIHVSDVSISARLRHLKLKDNYLWATHFDGIFVFDIGTPEQPIMIDQVGGVDVFGLNLVNTYAFASFNGAILTSQNKPTDFPFTGVKGFHLGANGKLEEVFSKTYESGASLQIRGDYLFADVAREDACHVFDISNMPQVVQTTHSCDSTIVGNSVLHKSHLFKTSRDDVEVYDSSDPLNLEYLGKFATSNPHPNGTGNQALLIDDNSIFIFGSNTPVMFWVYDYQE